jgi:hypothetical protein
MTGLDRLTHLRNLVSSAVKSKLINFYLTVERKHPELHTWIMQQTGYLPSDANFNERVYLLVNELKAPPLCPLTGTPLRFINFFKGYAIMTKAGRSANRARREKTPKPLPAKFAGLLEYASLVGSDEVSVGSKVKKFLTRNRERNAALYDLPEESEGIGYVVCPVLGIRTLNIRRTYVEGVLGMTWEEFQAKYPSTKTTCSGHSARLAEALARVGDDGLTAHAVSVAKSKIKKSAIDADGTSINMRKGRKTRETHMQVGADGLTGYQRLAMAARPKQIETLARQHKTAGCSNAAMWAAYRNFCQWISAGYKQELLDGRPSGRAGKDGAWQIDHRYSLIKAFHEKICPFVVSTRTNLIAIPWEENNRKRTACSVTLADLLAELNTTFEVAQLGFVLFERAFLEVSIRTSSALFLKMKEIALETDIPFEHRLRDSDASRLEVI